jgi:hypothetical protein
MPIKDNSMKSYPISKDTLSRIILFIVFSILLSSFVLRIIALNYRYLNEDEIEHLHVGYLISSGEKPYVDFFEHHLPMFHYLMSFLFTIIDNSKTIIFFMRWLMFLSVIIIFFIMFKIAALVFSEETAWLSIFFLSSNILFFEKSIEIRPDVPQTLFWLISLYMLIKGFRKMRYLFFVLSGISLGFGFTLTQKTIYLLAPVLLTFFIWNLLSLDKREFFKKFQFSLIFITSFSIPILILFLYFWMIGAFKDFFKWNFVIAALWGREMYPWEYMTTTMRQNSPFWIFGLGFTIFHFCAKVRNWKFKPEEMLMPLSISFLLFAIIRTPGPYKQTYMPILPIVAIYAGRSFEKGINLIKELSENQSLLVPFFLIFFFSIALPPLAEVAEEIKINNQDQLELIDFIHKITEPSDHVFDGWGYGIMRPSSFYYHMLTVGVVNMMGKENREEKIIRSIIENDTKVMIYDYRIKTYLPESTQSFLKENFVPLNFLDIWVAGKKLNRDYLNNSKGDFNLICDANYKIIVNGIGNEITVDGNKLGKKNSIYLKKGKHNIVVSGFFDNLIVKYDFERSLLLNSK